MAANGPRVVRIDEPGLRGLGARLLGGTTFGGEVDSPFSRFGTSVSGVLPPRARTTRESRFGVEDVRARIEDFVNGSYKPGSLAEFMAYLATRLLRLESRRSPDGRSVNYIVDTVSRQSVLAAEVDRRLSNAGIARLFGRTLDAEADARRRRAELTPEMADVRVLRHSSNSRAGKASFRDWDDLAFSSAAVFQGREMTAQGGETWLGFEVAKASADPEVNLALMRRMRDQGRAVIVPAADREEARAGRFVVGMPIVYREGAVRARLVDEDLSFASLASAFGCTVFQHFQAMAKRVRAEVASEPDKVVDLARFQRFRRRPSPVVQTAAPVPEHETSGTRSSATPDAARFVIRHELEADGVERLWVVDNVTDAVTSLDETDLSAGRYQKEDAFGVPVGTLVVDVAGGYSHLDGEGRFHNVHGPAVVPAHDSGDRPRYAVRGEFVTAREFRVHNEASVLRTGPTRASAVPASVEPEDGPGQARRFGR